MPIQTKTEWISSFKTMQLALNRMAGQIGPVIVLSFLNLLWFFAIATYVFLNGETTTGVDLTIPTWVAWSASILGGLYSVFVTLVSIRLAGVDRKMRFIELLDAKTWKLYLPLVAVSLITSIIIFVGSLLLVIPGIILMTMLIFASFALVWEELSIKSAFQQSWEYTKGAGWYVFKRLLFILFLMASTRIFAIVPSTGQLFSMILSVLLTIFIPFYLGETYRHLHAIQPQKLSMKLEITQKIGIVLLALILFAFLVTVNGIAQFVYEIYPFPYSSFVIGE